MESTLPSSALFRIAHGLGRHCFQRFVRRSSTSIPPQFPTWRVLSNERNPTLHGSTFMNAFEAQLARKSSAAQGLQSSRMKQSYPCIQRRLSVFLAGLATLVLGMNCKSKEHRFFVLSGDICLTFLRCWKLLRRLKMPSLGQYTDGFQCTIYPLIYRCQIGWL